MNTLKFGNGEWYGKTDTILAYNDLNSNYKPLPFNFSRASSATVINKAGLIEEVGSGQPRVDYKDDSKGALLLEPSRSNIVTDSATGRFKLPTPSLINTLAPDNSNLAVIPIVYSVANRYEYIISGGTYSTNAKLTYSWYRKRISTPMVDTYLGDLRPSGVNLSYVGDTKQIESNINGYDRFEAVLNITDGSATTTVRMYFGDVIGVGNSSIAYWGHQLEQGSYATSYIPTQGGVVTRNSDSCLQGGFQDKNIFGSTQGTAVFDIKWDELNYIFDFNVGGVEVIRIYNDNNTQWRIRDTTTSSWYYTGFNITQGQRTKIGFKWSGTEIVAFQNGVKSLNNGLIGSNTSVESITTNKLNNTSNMQFYNTALTDNELQKLTTI